MTGEEKATYLRIALSLQNIGIDQQTADRVVQTYEKVLKLKGKFSLEDAVEIQYRLDKKYAKKKVQK